MIMPMFMDQHDNDWTATKQLFEDTYGADPKIEYKKCRIVLKPLKQGNRPLRQFPVDFESIINQFPEQKKISDEDALGILVDCLTPALHARTWWIHGPRQCQCTSPTTAQSHPPQPQRASSSSPATQTNDKPSRHRQWIKDRRPICAN
ncbi:hypothetical protein VKS41_006307 [Umbelopsis sp. WA50703]